MADPKIVLVTQSTRLESLTARFNTLSQARFYVEHLGADFGDYEREHEMYHDSLKRTVAAAEGAGRVQRLPREYLPNFLFGPEDWVVALGRDGLVANTLKYLAGQPLVGVNPDPLRWDGVLLPFEAGQVAQALGLLEAGKAAFKAVSMAQAVTPDGRRLLAVNDLFIGARSHISARYQLSLGGVTETQSSSGLIVSTGLGSSGWLRSVLAGARGVMQVLNGEGAKTAAKAAKTAPKTAGGQPAGGHPGAAAGANAAPGSNAAPGANAAPGSNAAPEGGPARASGATPGAQSAVGGAKTAGGQTSAAPAEPELTVPWDADYLYFSVREPFPSRSSQAGLVFGRVTPEAPLTVLSQMPEHGVIFSDGVEQDFLEFGAGTRVSIGLAPTKGRLMLKNWG